ncbi:hypothetical protein HY631_01460 [Candidatus Uhrbacteria bacterium]|nr:hypothetical protein [Candidatus Uhrbacteria bacterium]
MPTKKKPAAAAPESVPAKPVAKKKIAKKSSKPTAAKKQTLVLDNAPVLMQETEVHKPDHTIEVHRKFVLVGTCSQCEHMPMHAGRLVALLSVVIAVLSVMLIAKSSPIDFSQFQFSFAQQEELPQSDSALTGGSR